MGIKFHNKMFYNIVTICFSVEKGKYIAVCNEAGSKGSEPPLKYHLLADGSDHILTWL